MIWVTEAKALPDFRLWARFSDGTEGEIDLKDFIAKDSRPIVATLCDPIAFSTLRVDMDTVVWDNGFDLAPEFLHAQAKAHVPA
ncbi:MAG: DUF2442 domain-containing protein [Betaproteobacteria bacterium]|nr:DUF2442 domain-containing protein [Betaproteobacteria bacterium]